MQMIWFAAIGPTDDDLVGGRLMGAVMRVYSHGKVRLRSDNPLVDPIVEFDTPIDELDTDCRVIGYEGVRVCDASVMPDLPKANTHLTKVAIAQRLMVKIPERPSHPSAVRN